MKNFSSKYIKIMLLRAVTILVIALVAHLPVSTLAWSAKGHVIITRMAVKLLLDDPQTPVELKNILKEGIGNNSKLVNLEDYTVSKDNSYSFDSGLDSFSIRPDELTATKSPVPAFDSSEPIMHFLDSEVFHPNPEKRKFASDGSNKVKPEDLPRNPKDERYKKYGMITFRTEQSYNSLVESFQVNYSNDQVFLWVGYLSHYVSDSYQPFHSTIGYLGYECPCNERREKKHNFHHDLEGLLFEDDSKMGQKNREKFWQYFSDAIKEYKQEQVGRLDPYLVSQEALLTGYDYLPMLCNAGQVALGENEFQADVWFNYQEKIANKEVSILQLKAQRMAQATIKLKTLILQAWKDSLNKNK